MVQKALPKQYKNWYKINDAGAPMGISHAQYVRQLVQKKFQNEKAINPNTGEEEPGAIKLDMGSYRVWVINPTIVEDYQARQTTRSGLRRYLLRFDATLAGAGAKSVIEEALQSVIGELYESQGGEITKDNFSFEPAYKAKTDKSVKATSEEGTDVEVKVYKNVGGLTSS